MPSGKVLWLCEEHQKKSRVTVLEEDDWEAPEFTAEPSAQEYALLEKLKAISEGAADKVDAEETGTGKQLSDTVIIDQILLHFLNTMTRYLDGFHRSLYCPIFEKTSLVNL